MIKVDFLSRLLTTLNCRDELLDFLVKEKIVPEYERQHLCFFVHKRDLPSHLLSILEGAVKSEKIQLLDYEWSILPKEHLKLTIVTAMDKLELIWDAV